MSDFILYNGDCLEIMPKLQAGPVDLILTDPPYGTIKGAELDGWKNSSMEWDEALKPADIFKHSERLLRTNGALALFSQEPYTSTLIQAAHGNLPFSYRLLWLKDHFANALLAKKAPVSYFEDVLVYRCKKDILKNYDYEGGHPLRAYSNKILEFSGKTLKEINKDLGHRCAEHFFYVDSTQFGLCTEKIYQELCERYSLPVMPGFRTYSDLKTEDYRFKQTKIAEREAYIATLPPVIFNLPEGQKYKSNVLQYKKDYTGFHPTQKPIALLEDLILTYTSPGDTVLDFTMGSGSTGVACANTGRKFIGIELDANYYAIAKRRIEQTYQAKEAA
jgi:hypothetical protein